MKGLLMWSVTAGCQRPAGCSRVRLRGRVEVLFLPPAEAVEAVCGGSCHAVGRSVELGRLVRAAIAGHPMEVLLPPTRVEELAWYRWMIGHQAAFLGWRMLRRAAGDGEPARAADLLGLYSVLLLYAGSCPPQVYARSIRPRMRRCHPAFSGEWAPDNHGLPVMLKKMAPADPVLREAWRVNRWVHFAVADRLVPDGGSLLQEAGRCPGPATPSLVEAALYDEFFLTRRTRVCGHDLRAQLQVRLLAILADVSSSGLYYQGPAVSATAAGERGGQIAVIEQSVSSVVSLQLGAVTTKEERCQPLRTCC